MKPDINVCIVQPNIPAYSETFIRNHAEHLPGNVKVLFGHPFPSHTEKGDRLLPLPLHWLNRASHVVPAWIGSACERVDSRILAAYLRRHRIDVVLAEYGTTGGSVSESCRRAGIPLVVHFHGFDAYEHATLQHYRRKYDCMFDSAVAIIAVSRDMESQLAAIGAPPEKIHYIPYGVNVSLFEGATPETAAPVFVSVGRFVDKKAPQLTLAAFGQVAAALHEAQLVMIGDGPLFEATRQAARSLGLQDRVEFKGRQTSQQVASAMREARVFVQHSIRTVRGDSEGTPVSILEAGAAGLPVVSTRHAGIKDVVQHGSTGFLVDEGDVAAMADFMLELGFKPTLAGSMGRQARQHIAQNFSLEQSISRLSAVLARAAAMK